MADSARRQVLDAERDPAFDGEDNRRPGPAGRFGQLCVAQVHRLRHQITGQVEQQTKLDRVLELTETLLVFLGHLAGCCLARLPGEFAELPQHLRRLREAAVGQHHQSLRGHIHLAGHAGFVMIALGFGECQTPGLPAFPQGVQDSLEHLWREQAAQAGNGLWVVTETDIDPQDQPDVFLAALDGGRPSCRTSPMTDASGGITSGHARHHASFHPVPDGRNLLLHGVGVS